MQQRAEIEMPRRRRRCAAASAAAAARRSDDLDDPVDAGVDAGGEIALAEFGRDVLGDDAPRRHVGERALEAVAHFDAHALVVLGDQQDRAVVLALVADLPRLGHADRVLLDRLGRGGRHDQHGELVGRARFPVAQLRLERLPLGRGQRAGLVGDRAASGGTAHEPVRRRVGGTGRNTAPEAASASIATSRGRAGGSRSSNGARAALPRGSPRGVRRSALRRRCWRRLRRRAWRSRPSAVR